MRAAIGGRLCSRSAWNWSLDDVFGALTRKGVPAVFDAVFEAQEKGRLMMRALTAITAREFAVISHSFGFCLHHCVWPMVWRRSIWVLISLWGKLI